MSTFVHESDGAKERDDSMVFSVFLSPDSPSSYPDTLPSLHVSPDHRIDTSALTRFNRRDCLTITNTPREQAKYIEGEGKAGKP